jgi:hypothetical protein
MNKKFILLMTLAVVVFVGAVMVLVYTTPPPPPPKAVAQHHITVLLDLSNRIDPKLGRGPQAVRDLQDIKAVTEVFKQQVKHNFYVNSRDQLSVLVSRQRGSTSDAQSNHQADFMVDMATLPLNNKQQKRVESLTDSLLQQTVQLYSQTQAQAAQQGYTGADIWSFFDTELPMYLLTGKKAPLDSVVQTLVIVTDGYNDFSVDILKKRPFSGNRTSYGQVNTLSRKPDPIGTFDRENYGMMASQKYPDLRVVVLELAPHGNDATHEQLILRYWNKWFLEMGIPAEHYKLLLNNVPPGIIEKAVLDMMNAPAVGTKAVAALK